MNKTKKVRVLLGSFTFLENPFHTIIHKVEKEEFVEIQDLDKFCEDVLNTYEGYFIPSMYNGIVTLKQSQNMNLQEIKIKHQAMIDAAMDTHNVFFAFSNKQLEEGIAKTPLAEGDKLVRLPHGGFIPKSKLDAFLAALEAASKFKKEALKSQRLRKQNIAYELNNHEAFYTGSIEDTLRTLGEDYTEAEVKEVYFAEGKKQGKKATFYIN